MKGMDMMFDALRKMIPPSVWELVEKNVVGIKSDTDRIARMLAEIRAQNEEILKRLGYAPPDFAISIRDNMESNGHGHTSET